MFHLRTICKPHPAWLLSAALLSACGSVSSTTSSTGTLFSGSVIDGPIANANITITANAPFGQTGATTLATTKADSSANYNVSVTLPSGNTPIYITATDPNNAAITLSSYVGLASTLAQTAQLSSTTTPNLTVSQVTTAALALIQAQTPALLATLTPADYNNVITGQNNQLVALAAGIQAVADGHCRLDIHFNNTRDMADQIAVTAASASNATNPTPLTSSAILTQTAAMMPASCQGPIQSLMQTIPANSIWSQQLQSGAAEDNSNTTATSASYAGTYQLQGYLLDTGIALPTPYPMPSVTPPTASTVMTAVNPVSITPSTTVSAPTLLNDRITIGTDGKISSTDNQITGTMSGSTITLTIVMNSQSAQIVAQLNPISSSLITSTTASTAAWRLSGGGTNTTNSDALRVHAVLFNSGTTPNWSALATGLATSNENSSICNSGSAIDLLSIGVEFGTMRFPMCVSSNATGITLSTSQSSSATPEHFWSMVYPSITLPDLALTEVSSTQSPFVLSSAPVTLSINNTNMSMTTYYVLGSHEFFYYLTPSTTATTTPSAVSPSYNGSLRLSGEGFTGTSDTPVSTTASTSVQTVATLSGSNETNH